MTGKPTRSQARQSSSARRFEQGVEVFSGLVKNAVRRNFSCMGGFFSDVPPKLPIHNAQSAFTMPLLALATHDLRASATCLRRATQTRTIPSCL